MQNMHIAHVNTSQDGLISHFLKKIILNPKFFSSFSYWEISVASVWHQQTIMRWSTGGGKDPLVYFGQRNFILHTGVRFICLLI